LGLVVPTQKIRMKAALEQMLSKFLLFILKAVFAGLRQLGRERASALGGFLARHLGRLSPAHRTALKNIAHVFPHLPKSELRKIALGAWDNLGRVCAEYAHLDTLFDFDIDNPDSGRCTVEGIEHFIALRDDAKPALLFSAHLGNWELPAICAARYGLDATAVFRAPNNPAFAELIGMIRKDTMGGLEAARRGAAFAMHGVLSRGGHLGMLIDQHFTRGVMITFLGKPAKVNPILGKFVREFDCPVHGVRVIRKDNGRFHIQLTPPLNLPRDFEGKILVSDAMQAMSDVVGEWVSEHPEQWLWQHRRWRGG
jgi:Kdo2-lipid IVA lauroyltransferase/acyltransferase